MWEENLRTSVHLPNTEGMGGPPDVMLPAPLTYVFSRKMFSFYVLATTTPPPVWIMQSTMLTPP